MVHFVFTVMRRIVIVATVMTPSSPEAPRSAPIVAATRQAMSIVPAAQRRWALKLIVGGLIKKAFLIP